jgi:hypothetical protein
MARLNFIGGKLRGKLGDFVFYTRDGETIVRSKGERSGGASNSQQESQAVFGLLTRFGSRINDSVLKPYQAKKQKGLSSFNVFVKANKTFTGNKNCDYRDIKIFDGPLPLGTMQVAAPAAGSNNVSVDVTPHTFGLADADDTIIVVAYNKTKDSYSQGFDKRGSGNSLKIDVPLPTDAGDEIFVYLTASRPAVANAPTLVSAITVQ